MGFGNYDLSVLTQTAVGNAVVRGLCNRSLSDSKGWLTISELRGRHSTPLGDKPQSQDVPLNYAVNQGFPILDSSSAPPSLYVLPSLITALLLK